MNFRSLIIIFSTFIWILIPLRQYKTRFFGYFLVTTVFEMLMGLFFILKNEINSAELKL